MGAGDGGDTAGGTPSEGVVLLTVDSLRTSALRGPTGSRVAPTLTALAGRGTRFENAFTHGNWTPFAFPSILASRPVFAAGPDIGLPDTPTLAEALAAEGVRTAGINAGNGFLTDHWGYDRGFDRFDPCLPTRGTGLASRYLSAHPTVQGWLALGAGRVRRAVHRVTGDTAPAGTNAASIADRATAVIESTDGPFFLWCHFMDPHTPYVPAPRHVRAVSGDPVGALRMLRAHVRTGLGWTVTPATLRRLRILYRAAVRGVDAAVGRILDALEATGRRADTTVVVAGDHGEAFQEHGHLAHYPTLYDELIHVPLLVHRPGAPPRRVKRAVGLDAVPPTVCEAMGVPVPRAFEGRSLLGTVDGGEAPPDGPVVSVAVRGERVTQQPIPRRLDEGELLVSARSARWAYIEGTGSGRRELYDRRADPALERNRWPRHADEPAVERLRAAAATHADRLLGPEDDRIGRAGGAAGGADEVPEALEERLSALGYR